MKANTLARFARAYLTSGFALLAITVFSPAAAWGQFTNYYNTSFETNQGFTNGAVANQGSPAWGATSIGAVVGTVGSITPPDGTQMLELTRPTSGDPSIFSVSFAGYQAGAKEDIKFSLLITADQVSNAAIGFSVGSSSQGLAGAWAGLRKVGDSFGFYYRTGTNSAFIQLGTSTLTLGEFVRFELAVSWTNSTFDLAVYNASNNVLLESMANIGLYNPGGTVLPMDNYNRVYGVIDQVGATKFYMDQINVQAIPEPSVAALAALGVAAFCYRRFRNTRRRA